MTTLIAHSQTDMRQWDFLSDILAGTLSGSSSTAWNVDGTGGATYSFTGEDLVFGLGVNPLPISGSIRNFSVHEFGTLTLAVSGGMPALDFVGYMLANDMTGLQRQWFSGDDLLTGSSGNDFLMGYSGADLFRLDHAGNDVAKGGKGADTFQMRSSFGATDHIDGGNGMDTLRLNADYFLNCTGRMLTNVERVELTQGKEYILNFAPATVGRDGLMIDGSELHAGRLEVHMSGGNNGFTASGGDRGDIFGGAGGDDDFNGRGGSDLLNGGGGADRLAGGNGRDTFVYGTAADSTSVRYDTLAHFDSTGDVISLGFAVGAIDSALETGSLSAAEFNTAMETAVNASVLGAHHAVLFTPDAGDLAHETFLVIDANNVAGYQHGEDFLMLLDGRHGLAGLGIEDFVLSV